MSKLSNILIKLESDEPCKLSFSELCDAIGSIESLHNLLFEPDANVKVSFNIEAEGDFSGKDGATLNYLTFVLGNRAILLIYSATGKFELIDVKENRYEIGDKGIQLENKLICHRSQIPSKEAIQKELDSFKHKFDDKLLITQKL